MEEYSLKTFISNLKTRGLVRAIGIDLYETGRDVITFVDDLLSEESFGSRYVLTLHLTKSEGDRIG